MSRALSTDVRGDYQLPATAREPELSGDLRFQIEQYSRLVHEGFHRPEDALTRLTVAQCQEAGRMAIYYERATASPHRDAIRQWVKGVGYALPRAPDDDQLERRIDSLMENARDIAVAAWTVETRIGFVGSMKGPFWPGDSEIIAYLRPISNAFKAKRRLLEMVADHVPQELGERPEPTEEERLKVYLAVREVESLTTSGHVKASAALARRVYVPSDQRLLEEYTRLADEPGMFQAACIARRDMLRRKLGVQEISSAEGNTP